MSIEVSFLVVTGIGIAIMLVYIATIYRFLEIKIESEAKDILLQQEHVKHRDLDELVKRVIAQARNEHATDGQSMMRVAIVKADEFESVLEKSRMFEQRQRLPGRGDGGFVYILHEAKISGLYKIGRTITPKGRIGHFDTTWAFDFEIVHIIQTAYPNRLERELHDRFWARRQRGEWFALTPADIDAIKHEYPS